MKRLRRLRGRNDRGVALLMVLLSVTLLIAVATRYSYEAYIDYQLAVNAADEAQAYNNAMSGLALYKLILSADKQVTGNPQLKQLGQQFGINVEAYGLWQLIPELDTRLIRNLASDDLPAEDKAAIQEMFGAGIVEFVTESEGFLDFEGDFHVRIENEDGKININQFPEVRHLSVLDSPIGRALYALMLDEQYDPIFEGTNALGEKKLSREEVIANIDDWVDPNSEPIQFGGGSEDALYYRYEDEYRARNQKMETLYELNFVRGVDDDFMEAFGDRLTVFSGGKININTAGREVISGLLLAYSQSPLTPQQAGEYADMVLEYRALQPFAKVEDFVTFAREALGLELQAPTQAGGGPAGPAGGNRGGGATPPGQGATGGNILTVITTDSKVFKIVSTGYAGEARTTITTVVDNTGTSLRYLYWRVD